MNNKISIIISYTNRYELVVNCINHLYDEFNNRDDIEVILVADEYCSIKLNDFITNIISKSNNIFNVDHTSSIKLPAGYSIANNTAASYAKGKYLLFLNTDVFTTYKSISILHDKLENDSTIGIAQGKLIFSDEKTIQTTGHIFSDYRNSHTFINRDKDDEIVNIEEERQGVTSAFYMLKKSDYDKLNGFDEYYFNAWDGLDLSLKVRYELKKKCLYVPSAEAIHTHGASRKIIYRNQSYQDAYFWTKWKKYLVNDYKELIKKQLPDYIFDEKVYLINCSTTKKNEWKSILSLFNNCEYLEIDRIQEKESIKLKECIDLSLLYTYHKIVFLCDNFKDLESSNTFFMKREKSFNDKPEDKFAAIVDHSGSVLPYKIIK